MLVLKHGDFCEGHLRKLLAYHKTGMVDILVKNYLKRSDWFVDGNEKGQWLLK